MSLFTNPEIVRNARIQLRPRRMISAAALCAALEVTLIYFYAHNLGQSDGTSGLVPHGGQALLTTILWIQAIVLVIGGGIASIHAIQCEKDQNTFDFQRLTRLSPFELTIGKLFGPPLMVYFVFACFLPAAIVGAVASGASWQFVLAAYALLILGAIVYMAFALVISLYLQRGTATWAILFYLLVVVITADRNGSLYWGLGPLSPFFGIELARESSWTSPVRHGVTLSGWGAGLPSRLRDLFFGVPVHHALVLFVLYVTVLVWFLIAVARNIKRDPANYELYTPAQALGFLCYLNFILFAFFQWQGAHKWVADYAAPYSPLRAQSDMLAFNITLFFIFGFILLRNRNRMRRRLHSIEAAPTALESVWPAPYIFLGAILLGAAMILVIQWKRDPSLEWSLVVAIFRVIFFAVWLSRDLLFLQWMTRSASASPAGATVAT
ncbi:MAG: hypothetical protein ACYDCD_11975 [Candidatus Acidiferrales bacterium]